MTIEKHYWVTGAIEEYYELLYPTKKDKSNTNKTNGKFYNGPLSMSDKSKKKASDFRPGDVLYSTLNGELVSQKQSDGHKNVPIAVCAINDPESNCVQFVSLNYLNCSNYKHGDKLPMLFYYPMTYDLCGANKQSKLNFPDNRVSNNYNKWFNKPIEDEEYAKHFLSGSENYEIMMREVSKFTHISNGAPADQVNGGAVLTYNYRTLGTRCGDWYIPSASELYRMSLNNNAVETSRYEISGSTLFNVSQSFMTSGELDKAQYIKYGYHPQYHSACVSSKGIMAPIIVFMQIKK